MATKLVNKSKVELQVSLTTNSLGGLKNGCHLRVHLDCQVLLYKHLFVSGGDLELYPIGELLLQYSGTHINYPLLWSLWKLKIRFREVSVHYWVLFVKELLDLLDSEAFIPVK